VITPPAVHPPESADPVKLSVLVPIYNEDRETLVTLLQRVAAQPIQKEIIVVDDGSTIQPGESIAAAKIKSLSFFAHDRNFGKGAAVRTALQHARGQVVIIQDADLEYFPEDYVPLLQAYEQRGGKHAIYGVRDLQYRSVVMRFGNWLVTTVTNLLYQTRLKDMETCYKMVSRETLLSLNLQSSGFDIEAEITSKLLRRGVHITEVPIKYNHRDFGKKLSVMDGLPTVWMLARCRTWRMGGEMGTGVNNPHAEVVVSE
jgi:glycosyltransferase involved in cell wall biosynthesis